MILRRLAWTIVVAWFVATLTFVLAFVVPASPARAMLGPRATTEATAAVSAELCLDRGTLVAYGCWLERIAHGDLGTSYRQKRGVGAIIRDRAWPTAQLALAAIVLQLGIGVPLGVWAARRRGRWPDRATSIAAVLAQSVPPFVVGLVAIYVFAFGLGLFPIGGSGSLAHLVLPAFTLATIGIATYARAVRGELAGALDADYVRTARAKGASERAVVWRHALRNAAGPLVTLVGIDLGVLLGGAVIVESIFAWPGLGRELWFAILEVDLPVIVGIVLVGSLAITVANSIADLVLVKLDPRLGAE